MVGMTTTMSLRDANQQFARCIRAVEAGEEVVVTRNGKPVARIVPVSGRRVLSAAQFAAWKRTEARMSDGWPLGTPPLDRDALHERLALHARHQCPHLRSRC